MSSTPDPRRALWRRLVMVPLTIAFLASGCGDTEDLEPAAQPESIYGFWDLVEIDGEEPLSVGLDPFLCIDVAPAYNEPERAAGESQMSAFDGCRNLSGSYALDGDLFQAVSLDGEAVGCGDEIDAPARRLGRSWPRRPLPCLARR